MEEKFTTKLKSFENELLQHLLVFQEFAVCITQEAVIDCTLLGNGSQLQQHRITTRH